MCTNSRRSFLMQSVLAVGAAAASPIAFAAGAPAKAAKSAITYICPPCGCAADGQEFPEPGTCPECGMELIEKSSAAIQAQPKVAILVFEGVQIIDFAAPYEVFGQAGYDVFTVAASTAPLNTNMNLVITPRYSFANAPKPDVLLIPGGSIRKTMRDNVTIEWLRSYSEGTRQTISVCNGAFFLAAGHLLDGLSATTYYNAIDDLKSGFPAVNVVSDRRFVDNGHIVTTAGLSSGIDGALHIVSKLSGRAAAQMAALNMEYNWREDASYARASFADRHLRRIFGGRLQLDLPDRKSFLESTTGDRGSWEMRWLVLGAGPASGVTQAIGDTIARNSDWTLLAGSAGDSYRSYRFVDENHIRWDARLDTASVGMNGALRSTLRLRAT